MNNLIVRSLSGIIYAGVIIAALTSGQAFLWGTVLFSVFLFVESTELVKLLRLNQKVFIPLIALYWLSVTSLISYYSIAFRYHLYLNRFFFIMQIILWLLLSIFLIYLILTKKFKTVAGFFYLIIPYTFTLVILLREPLLILFLFIIIWINDTFAYLTGKFLGKHKLAPSISPNKTIEGLIGGGFFVLLLTYWGIKTGFAGRLFYFLDERYVAGLTVLLIFLILLATAGDLFESYLKRKAGVKDSGNIIPGHGGILDRLDSYMFAVTGFFIYLFIYFKWGG